MAEKSKNEASIPNPALKLLSVLVGKWNTVGTHPMVPGTIFHGRASFEWLEGGAFLIMRSEIDEPEIPSGIAIFGSDDVTKKLFMLYFDERGISRKYNVSFKGNTLMWWRNTPEFSQRMTCKVSDDEDTIVSQGVMSKDGSNWEGDLELTYTRVK
ncbi:MAG: hypothetical protein A2826_00810 [Candidatus Doudnabacteria bacterium RIFCSPHIGHO2_01_FULL_43_23]|uniref:DUF1579 domain-containing protein n=1 Tax=Candidatus Doudnabacteria bacterium RIFCSPHIGHO2_01_FULL_43_23 TaxID=1817822 RepID=A0A1F5NRG9_9BACT|nr:MAG: hypothetical protein A2826_00810 [Candidatus Doudnabacteria bacterium RIFCSPHIGHO2_01_FULL_43_23]